MKRPGHKDEKPRSKAGMTGKKLPNSKEINFGVSEHIFHLHRNGKMICHSTGEIRDEKQMREDAKRTWIKFTPTT